MTTVLTLALSHTIEDTFRRLMLAPCDIGPDPSAEKMCLIISSARASAERLMLGMSQTRCCIALVLFAVL
jgi:hypothetical protein